MPPGQTANSGVFGNVLLTQGAVASLGIIPAGELDVSAAVTARVGEGGYEIPFLKLSQRNVPTNYDLGPLSLSDLTNVLKSLSTNNSQSVNNSQSANYSQLLPSGLVPNL